MVELNLVGWLPVLGPGAAVGVAWGVSLGRPPGRWGAMGAMASYGAALVVDNRRYRRSPLSMAFEDLDPADLRAVAAELRRAGMDAGIRSWRDDDGDVEGGRDLGAVEFGLVVASRHRSAVRRAVAARRDELAARARLD